MFITQEEMACMQVRALIGAISDIITAELQRIEMLPADRISQDCAYAALWQLIYRLRWECMQHGPIGQWIASQMEV